MTEDRIEVTLEGGTAEVRLYRPDGAGPWPGILHLSDIWGIRPPREAMARRQAEMGYVVLLPNVFWRLSKVPLFDFTPQLGEARTMARLNELFAALTPAQMSDDAGIYLDVLEGLPQVKPGRLGVVGYCFTGAMALRAAAARPDRVGAVASFHGVGLAGDAPDSPHTVLPAIKARLYFGHAIEDRTMPPAMIEKLETALRNWGGSYKSETWPAHHGWTIPGPAYDVAQSERHFEVLREMFGEALG